MFRHDEDGKVNEMSKVNEMENVFKENCLEARGTVVEEQRKKSQVECLSILGHLEKVVQQSR